VALHDDLLVQAAQLARVDKKKPKQANLRRAVSAAYYALFHLLIDASTRFLVSGPQREALRQQLARSFDHGQMKTAAKAFASGNQAGPWIKILGAAPSADLVDVAKAFIELQEARHEADYDLSRSFTRFQADQGVALAQNAFRKWNVVSGKPEGEVFLVALLVKSRS